jgi:acetolactate synthase-1/3 small subunit
VGPTENPDISRMTIVINVESHSLEQVIRQLDKLVNVIHIAELKLNDSVQAELLLVKISATSKNRFDVDAVLETYGAVIVERFRAFWHSRTGSIRLSSDRTWQWFAGRPYP